MYVGKVGMSVLVKGLAMDFVRQGRNEMAVTSIWPASVCALFYVLEAKLTMFASRLSLQLQSITRHLTSRIRKI